MVFFVQFFYNMKTEIKTTNQPKNIITLVHLFSRSSNLLSDEESVYIYIYMDYSVFVWVLLLFFFPLLCLQKCLFSDVSHSFVNDCNNHFRHSIVIKKTTKSQIPINTHTYSINIFFSLILIMFIFKNMIFFVCQFAS